MSRPGLIKGSVISIIAVFAIAGIAGSARSASSGKSVHEARGQGNTNPMRQETPAQPSLPVVTMSEPQTASTPATGSETGNEFSAHQLLAGNERGIVHPVHKILRSKSQLETLLQQIYSGQVPPEAPQIDFSRQVLVYYSLGTETRRHDNVYIRSGSLEHGVLHVYVEIAHSSGDCLATSSLTAPFVIAALPFPAREVRRAEYEITHKNYPCT